MNGAFETMHPLNILALSAPLIALAWTPAQAHPLLCGPRAEVVHKLDAEHQEAPVAIGLLDRGDGVLEVFASDDGGFTVVVTRPDGLSCLLAAGGNWESVPEKKPPA